MAFLTATNVTIFQIKSYIEYLKHFCFYIRFLAVRETQPLCESKPITRGHAQQQSH